MKTRFAQLTLAGFRSFKSGQPLEFVFPRGAGFNYLRGRNGSGKSSIWDGLTWVLYGKSTRGLKAGDVATWEDEGLTVGSVDVITEAKHTIQRTWNPNELTIDGKVVEQLEVDKLLGMGYDAFLNVVLMAQFGRMFFDLGDTEKLNVFSDVLRLGVWLEASDKVRKLVKDTTADISFKDSELAGLEGQLRTLKNQRIEAKQHAEQWNLERADAIKTVQRAAGRLAAELTDARNASSNASQAHKKLGGDVSAARERLVKLDDCVKEQEARMGKLALPVRDLERDLDQLAHGVCPACKQPISNVQKKRDALASKLAELRPTLNGARHELVTLTAKRDATGQRLQELEASGRDAFAAVHKASTLKKQAELTYDACKQELERLETGKNPHEEQLEGIRSRFTSAKQRLEATQQELDKLRQDSAALSYWVTGFKEIRLWQIEEALQELEISVNNALQELGLNRWRITFDVEKETKGGTVSKGFSVLVHPPGKKAVRWESFSGGETQDLRLAGACGLADMIRAHWGINPTLEVWDEPTQFLEGEAVESLLQFLETRARENNRQIWIVDHRSMQYAFDETVHVKRSKDGSYVA